MGFHPLVDSVLATLGEAFPELKKNPEDVKAIIKAEEEQFGRTLDTGIKEFKNRAKKGKISADDAFVLFSSYGFPVDLTELMGEEMNVPVDKAGFEVKMEEERAKSRAGGSFKKTKDMQFKAAETD